MAGLNIHRIPSRVEGQELPITQVDISEMDRNVRNIFQTILEISLYSRRPTWEFLINSNLGISNQFISFNIQFSSNFSFSS